MARILSVVFSMAVRETGMLFFTPSIRLVPSGLTRACIAIFTLPTNFRPSEISSRRSIFGLVKNPRRRVPALLKSFDIPPPSRN